MSIGFERFVELSGCEVVADNLIIGIQAGRKVVGTISNGVFELTEEGQRLSTELEAAAAEVAEKPTTRRKKVEEPSPAAEGEQAA